MKTWNNADLVVLEIKETSTTSATGKFVDGGTWNNTTSEVTYTYCSNDSSFKSKYELNDTMNN